MMRWRVVKCVSLLLLLGLTVPAVAGECPDFLDHEQRKLHSRDSVNLCEVAAGKPMLVVNTASRCGYTGQFEGLEALHQQYKDRGLAVVGFASDDFRQEADTEEEAAKVCFVNFGVTFTMIAPTPVTGEQANPVFREINRQSEQPRWNFTKYVVDRSGKVVERFPSKVRPDDPQLIEAVESVL
ncbi:glutathione peroxidase [Marinobacter vinifirmus]|uniref:Glutathione peroxidase n=1 Tax=Marinobacter vinifirmus TaxID=355591 RepID=A0A558BII7_9GAMM|nr:glutathione peroxidase [Marinobacter vinifirmus]TVT36312.1 MAG: glutathione peroxidase [Marinobacter vinifirmus]